MRPVHARRQSVHVVHVAMVGVMQSREHHRGWVMTGQRRTEHGVVLVVGQLVCAQRAQRGHVVPPQEQIPRVGAHVAMVHGMMCHSIPVVVLVPLRVRQAVRRHVVCGRTQLVAHQ